MTNRLTELTTNYFIRHYSAGDTNCQIRQNKTSNRQINVKINQIAYTHNNIDSNSAAGIFVIWLFVNCNAAQCSIQGNLLNVTVCLFTSVLYDRHDRYIFIHNSNHIELQMCGFCYGANL